MVSDSLNSAKSSNALRASRQPWMSPIASVRDLFIDFDLLGLFCIDWFTIN